MKVDTAPSQQPEPRVELSKAPPVGASVAERTEYVRRWQLYDRRKRELLVHVETCKHGSETGNGGVAS